MLMPIYTAQWEMKLATRDQRQVEAQQARLARAVQLAAPPTPFKDRSLTERRTLKRLVNALGYAGR